MLMGPNGFLEMKEASSAPPARAHEPDDTAFYDVKAGDFMKLQIGGPCAMTFDRMLVRVHADFRLEVHIDTDEATPVPFNRILRPNF